MLLFVERLLAICGKLQAMGYSLLLPRVHVEESVRQRLLSSTKVLCVRLHCTEPAQKRLLYIANRANRWASTSLTSYVKLGAVSANF